MRGVWDGRAAQLHPRGAARARAAFVIATVELRVSAVSVGAEEIFGPEHVGDRAPLLDLVASPMGDDRTSRKLVSRAAVARA